MPLSTGMNCLLNCSQDWMPLQETGDHSELHFEEHFHAITSNGGLPRVFVHTHKLNLHLNYEKG